MLEDYYQKNNVSERLVADVEERRRDQYHGVSISPLKSCL